MKILIYKLSTILFAWLITLNINADPIQDIDQKMSSNDSAARALSMRHFVTSLGTANGEAYMTQAIPVLINGLEDSTVNVRRSAIRGLLMIAAQTMRARYPSIPGKPDLTAYQPSQNALLKATSDPDSQVRQTALQVYAITYKLDPDLEDKIIQEFNAPDPAISDQPSNKNALLESLMISGSPSAKATKFLTELLDDPKYGTCIAERMAADKCPLPGAALDKLATKLAQEKDPISRANYARAIGSYGKQAQRYTPQLRAALANEKDETTKANLQAAITQTQ